MRLPEAPAPVENTPVDIEGMTILYSDDDIVAVDKPPGVAAHATVGWHGPTVLGGLAAAGFRISTSGIHERQGIVHRLDVGTSGVMVVALSERAYTVLKRAFKQRTVDKRYHALVQGHPDPSSGTIDAPIGRHRGHDWKFAVTEHGRHSVTHYDTIEAHQAASLLDIHLETGRTHQIRVHFAALHHPCCGDLTYGADPTWRKSLGCNGNGCTRGRWRSPIPPTAGASRSPVPTRPTCSTRSTCCATRTVSGEQRRSGLLFGVGRLRLVGAVSRVLPTAQTRGRVRDPGAPHRVELRADGRGRRRGAPARRPPRDQRPHLAAAAAASALISANWGIYIYAVNNGHVVDAALGLLHQPAGDRGAGAGGVP